MQKERKSSGINIGSASIIMVFSVLCLTVFAVLTLITANSEYELAVRASDGVKNYYAADVLASKKLAALKEAIAGSNGSVDPIFKGAAELDIKAVDTSEGIVFYYSEKVDENQDLVVQLTYAGGELKIMQWKLVNNREWNLDDTIKFWDGEF